LTLLKEKAPKVHLNIESYISKIILKDKPPPNLSADAVAYIDPQDNNACVICGSTFYNFRDKVISAFRSKGIAVAEELIMVGAIVHETAHAQLNDAWLTPQLSSSDCEFIAELAAYRAWEMLGAPPEFLKVFKEVNIKTYLYK